MTISITRPGVNPDTYNNCKGVSVLDAGDGVPSRIVITQHNSANKDSMIYLRYDNTTAINVLPDT